MGAYINPPRPQTKEQFLEANGIPVSLEEVRDWNARPEGCLPVCLVDNGYFTAAGICYSPAELKVFTAPGDPRPASFFYVEQDKLLEVSDLATYLS